MSARRTLVPIQIAYLLLRPVVLSHALPQTRCGQRGPDWLTVSWLCVGTTHLVCSPAANGRMSGAGYGHA